LGYECKVKTDNVAQYLSPLKVFGEVDFLLAFREPSLKMLHRAEEKVVFRDLRVRVLRPEDLIGLKLQAIKNNPDRRAHEMEDILFLAIHYREELDWSLVQEYVKILEVWEIFNEIQRRLKGS
jgi:predicted nucleotidyltransferase